MATSEKWRQSSDRALARQLRPVLDEAYGTLPPNEAWLEQLVHVIRPEMERLADAVPQAAWALDENLTISEEAATALEQEAARPVLVRMVAELARVVLLDEATAAHLIEQVKDHYREEQGWTASQVVAPLRAALTGRQDGPSLAAIMALLGRERCMSRLAAPLR